MFLFFVLACAGSHNCGTGTTWDGSQCVADTGDTGTEQDQWDIVFSEDWDDIGNWSMRTNDGYSSALFDCDAVDNNLQVWTTYLSARNPTVQCEVELVRRLDLSDYETATLRFDYDVSRYDTGGADDYARVYAFVSDGDSKQETDMGWGAGGDGTYKLAGTVDVSLDSYAGWSDRLAITMEMDMSACKDSNSPSNCGTDSPDDWNPYDPDKGFTQMKLGHLEVRAR